MAALMPGIPPSQRSNAFIESRRQCVLEWPFKNKLVTRGRQGIDVEDAKEAIRWGFIMAHASNRARYIARLGLLEVMFEAPRPCHSYCITAYRRRR